VSTAARSFGRLTARFVLDDRGQDLVEYGLLTLIVSSALIAIFPTLQTSIQNAFTNWGVAINNDWVPNAPGP
jgi:Flp pilus assembly pilin Flp